MGAVGLVAAGVATTACGCRIEIAASTCLYGSRSVGVRADDIAREVALHVPDNARLLIQLYAWGVRVYGIGQDICGVPRCMLQQLRRL
jgi:hypothetical protein